MAEPQESQVEVFLNRTMKVTAWVTSALIILMMLLVVSEVFQRYVLNAPSKWISDFVTEYLLIYVALLPAAWILLVGGHVNVELIVSRLRPKHRHNMSIATNILGLIYSIVLTWQGWLWVWRELTHGTTFATTARLPVWPAVGVIFIGGVFLCLAFITRIAGGLRLHNGGKL